MSEHQSDLPILFVVQQNQGGNSVCYTPGTPGGQAPDVALHSLTIA
jgi:hypothetical protein